MTAVLYVFVYAALVVFVVASAVRAVLYARMPMHLRWELYPVPHEPHERLKHGGSYLEVPDWWTEPRHVNRVAEVGWMAREILLLKGLWDANRRLWFRSFPFHFGLYLLFGSAGLLVLAGIRTLGAPDAPATPIGQVLHAAYLVTGAAGLALGIAGAASLLHRRLTDATLRNYTTPADLFNLLFFIASFGLLGAGFLARPAGSPGPLALVVGLLTFDTQLPVPSLLAAGVIVASLLVGYIPLTHMSHYVAKYFTYHYVRWDDAPAHGNRALAARVAEYLAYRPTWSAPHVTADGRRTWGEVATTNPAQGTQK